MMNVAVVVGGDSEERDISIASGAQITKALRSLSVETVVIDTSHGLLSHEQEIHFFNQKIQESPPKTQQFSWKKFINCLLSDKKILDRIDVFFLALHGGSGENGTLQAFFDLIKKPYTGSGFLASACAFDKVLSKKMMTLIHIPTPDWVLANENSIPNIPRVLKGSLIVKPSQQGSTVGLTIVHQADQLLEAIYLAKQFDSQVIVEQFIEGREITVGILDGKALPAGEIILPPDIEFDYLSKYQPNKVQEIFPADIPQVVANKAQQYAEKLHHALGLTGYSRADFRLDNQDNLWCLEINSLPGMTEQSLLPKAAAASNISFAQLCLKICELALKRAV